MQPCGTPAVLQYTAAASAGEDSSEAEASATKATEAPMNEDFFHMITLLISKRVRSCDEPSDHCSRRGETHGAWRRCATSHEDGVREIRPNDGGFRDFQHAMNMAAITRRAAKTQR